MSHYFENDRGYSGTARWVAKVEKLPSDWKIQSKRAHPNPNMSQFITTVSRKDREPLPDDLQLVELPTSLEDERLVKVKIKNKAQTDELESLAAKKDIEMVEELFNVGQWLYDSTAERLYYVRVREGQTYFQGMVRSCFIDKTPSAK